LTLAKCWLCLLRFSLVFIIFFGAAAAVVLILIDFFFEQLAKIGGKFFVLRSERRCCSKAKVYSSKNHDHELTLQFSCI